MARLAEATIVPRHIDRNDRVVEYLIAGFGTFYGSQYFLGPGMAFVAGVLVAALFARFTAGKPPGFLVQSVLYGRLRIAVADALIDPRVRALRP